MIQVLYPEPRFQIKLEGGRRLLLDPVRKSWVPLTEEEWVRQNFVNYLSVSLQYPLSCIAVEKEIYLNDLKKRFDILIYDRDHRPWMMVECKAPSIPLNEAVLLQVLRYHISVPVQFIIITNGEQTKGWKKEGEVLQLINELPSR